FERNLALVSDPFTAASIVAAGAAPKAVAERLRGLLRAALHQTADGAAELPVPEGVVRADGRAPLPAEATALAALALDDARARADLGATLLCSYTPGGWGDGRTNLAALRAVLAIFR